MSPLLDFCDKVRNNQLAVLPVVSTSAIVKVLRYRLYYYCYHISNTI